MVHWPPFWNRKPDFFFFLLRLDFSGVLYQWLKFQNKVSLRILRCVSDVGSILWSPLTTNWRTEDLDLQSISSVIHLLINIFLSLLSLTDETLTSLKHIQHKNFNSWQLVMAISARSHKIQFAFAFLLGCFIIHLVVSMRQTVNHLQRQIPVPTYGKCTRNNTENR